MGEKEREVILSFGWLRAGIEADYNLMMAAKSVARSAKKICTVSLYHVCGHALLIPI